MVASYINILKSSADFTNVFRGTYESQRMVAANVVPSTSKIKIPGSEFKLSRYSENLRKSIYQI